MSPISCLLPNTKATGQILLTLLAVCFAVAISCRSPEEQSFGSDSNTNKSVNTPPEKLIRARTAVERFFNPMGDPGPFDWLATFKEPGQTFEEYLNANPTLPTAERKIIYVQPLGKFTAYQSQVINAATGYIEAYYGLPVKLLPTQSFSSPIGENDVRIIDYPKHRQIRSGYILESILQPVVPKDAAALIAFTNEDLYPDSSMFFVFGQANLANRVGVWSLYRLDDDADYDLFLRRALKIAAHEIGHMFTMLHCTKYECVMSGSNHLGETDSRPLDACPECMAKVCWMTNIEPEERYRRLFDYCTANGMTAEAQEFRKKMVSVSGVEK